MTRRHAPGIASYHGRWRVYVRVRGHYRSQILPADSTPDDLRDAREELRVDLRRQLQRSQAPTPALPKEPDKELFSSAAARYLPSVRSMPTYDERARDIGLWVAEFGDRSVGSIESVDIRTILERWIHEGPRMVQFRATAAKVRGQRRTAIWKAVPGPLSASTVNHRARALQNLWTVLWPKTPNPARGLDDYDEGDAAPRAIPADLVERILAALPDRGSPKKGKKRPTVSQSKARLRVMATVGLPNKQLGALKPEDIDWEGRTIYVTRRRKGKGVAGQRRPVTSQGIEALQALDAADAWGPFPRSVTRRAWRAACAKVQKDLAAHDLVVDLSRLRPYDLRHTVATAVLEATGDVDALAALMGHGNKATSLQYAKAAVPAWLRDAADKLDALQRGEGAMNPAAKKAKKAGRKLHTKLRETKKASKRRR